jgi:hypothetical protein
MKTRGSSKQKYAQKIRWRICHTAALRQSYGKKQVKHGFPRPSIARLGKNQVLVQQIFTGIIGSMLFHAFYGYAIAVFR